jgi:hypothetical protein
MKIEIQSNQSFVLDEMRLMSLYFERVFRITEKDRVIVEKKKQKLKKQKRNNNLMR